MDMMKRITVAILISLTVTSLCSCDLALPSVSDVSIPSKPVSEIASSPAEPEPPQYTVSFEEDETFADDISRRAAEIIDPAIRTAVTMLNTLPEQEFDILPDCLEIAEEYGMRDWNGNDDSEALDGVRIVCKFRDGEETIRVSSEQMPENGEQALEAMRAMLADCLREEFLLSE